MSRRDGAVLLTGATGFVGMELLARYLERTERPVLTIVRADSDDAARERIDAVLENLFGYRAGRYADRVTAVAGDLTAPRLGLERGALGAARRGEHDDRPQRRVGVVRPAARGGAGDQRRGDPADARARRPVARAGRARALRPDLDRVRGRHPRRPVLRVRSRRRAELPQLLRAVEVRGRAAGPLAPGPAVHDPASEHRRRRPQQRLDRRVQRPVLAAARVRARSVPGGAGDRVGPGRRRLDRLRRRRDPRAVRDRARCGRRIT